MLEVEVLAKQSTIDEVRPRIAALAHGSLQEYEHRGLDGAAGLLGLMGLILPVAIPALFDYLKAIVAKDRDLTLVLNGNEFRVRDVGEFSEVLDILIDRGLVKPDELSQGGK